MRYLPHTEADRQAMLAKIGVLTVEDLFKSVPDPARLSKEIEDLSWHLPEYEVDHIISNLAARNLSTKQCPSFLGAGAYRHHVPASVDQLLLRGEFLTSYTPYQPEVSQGTLQYLFEFQTQVAMLTGMEVANASMYDGATASAEAVMMANRITQRNRVVISGGLHPHYRDVICTMARMTGFQDEARDPSPNQFENLSDQIDETTSCVVVQYPDLFGRIQDYSKLAETCHAKGALLIVAVTEIISLGLLKPPGEMGADVVVAEGQSIGNGLNFGGPYVGLFACREKFVRQMPGRLCGQSVDADGKRSFVLTLSAREQHIRREKATSNICTNSGLCALAFTMHLTLLGDEGLTKLAELNHAKTCQLVERLSKIPGCRVLNDSFFNEFTLALPKPASSVIERLTQYPILGGVPLSRFYPQIKEFENLLLIAVTELGTDQDIENFDKALREVLS